MCRLAAQLGAAPTRQRQYSGFPLISTGADGVTEVLLGRGGFAQVFLATAEDGESVAVKRMTQGLPFDRFLQDLELSWATELMVACAANHPHVLGCYCWGIEVLGAASGGSGRRLFRLRMALPLMLGR